MFARRVSPEFSVFALLAVGACVGLSACSGFTGLTSAQQGVTQASQASRALSFRNENQNVAAGGNTWSTGASAPTEQFTGAAAAVGANIYLVGGENHTEALNENDVYDTSSNKWHKAKSMPTARTALAAAAVHGLVYAIGGETFTGTPLTTVEAYDPSNNTWSPKAPLPVAVDSMTATVDHGLIYVVGGLNDSSGMPFDGVQTYDPIANSWAPVASLNVAKAFAFTGTVGTQIVAAGGFVGNGPTTENEVYDPIANAWTPKSNALLARYGGCAGAIGKSLYAAGGLKFTPIRAATKELDAYEVATDHWKMLARMPTAVIGPASATVRGRLYCIGGSPRLGQPVFLSKVQIYQP